VESSSHEDIAVVITGLLWCRRGLCGLGGLARLRARFLISLRKVPRRNLRWAGPLKSVGSTRKWHVVNLSQWGDVRGAPTLVKSSSLLISLAPPSSSQLIPTSIVLAAGLDNPCPAPAHGLGPCPQCALRTARPSPRPARLLSRGRSGKGAPSFCHVLPQPAQRHGLKPQSQTRARRGPGQGRGVHWLARLAVSSVCSEILCVGKDIRL